MSVVIRRHLIAFFLGSGALVSLSPGQPAPQPGAQRFEKSWVAVDSLIGRGLTVSAGDTVERIYRDAKAASDPDQTVKALMYRMRLIAEKEENALVKSIECLRAEVKDAAAPAAALLHSALGECYWRYYQGNRWRLLDRSRLSQPDDADMGTWDLQTILEKTAAEYERSLSDPARLKRTRLDVFEEAIVGKEHFAKLRPTLYDFLAHRAVDFYSSAESELTRPAFAPALNSALYFKPFEEFIRLKLPAPDSASAPFAALRILQDLIIFHADNNELDALIEADLKRLTFVRDHAVLANGDSLYLRSLMMLEKIAPYSPASAEVTYAIARQYRDWADGYVHRKEERYRWTNWEALSVCQRAVKAFPESFGGRSCAALAAQINRPDLSITTEYVATPGKPFKALVSYRNIATCYWRILGFDMENYRRMTRSSSNDSILVNLLKCKPLTTWSAPLPDPGDHQRHSVELPLPALAAGHYVVLCASDSGFWPERNVVAFCAIQVTRLSSIERRKANGGLEMHVLDRETGAPVKGVRATLRRHMEGGWTGDPAKTVVETAKSDKEGALCLRGEPRKGNFSYSIELKNGDDSYFPSHTYYLCRTGKPTRKKVPRSYFFTDRSLYRPGQTVHFKGILVKSDGKGFKAAGGENVDVTFTDGNGREAGKLHLTANGFGSVYGSFIAPLSCLSGQMIIGDGHGSVAVSVEEYKRPRFQVAADTFKGAPRLGDTAVFTGTAKAYSGAAVSGAKVAYRVSRGLRTPDTWWRELPDASGQTEITRGTTVTSDTGGFSIAFPVLPDPAINPKDDPVFTFTVAVDVTDPSGETRSASGDIDVGYGVLHIAVDAPENLNRDAEPKGFSIISENCRRTFEPAKGGVTICRLETPVRPLRQRLWGAPDTSVLTKARHDSLFPNDQFDRESDRETWRVADTVFRDSFDTRQSAELAIPGIKGWKCGVYRMEAEALDRFGKRVTDRRFFTLFSAGDTKPPTAAAQWFATVKDRREPGEKAAVLIGSGYENTLVLCEIEHNGGILQKRWLPVNASQRLIEVPVEEKHRGNFSITTTFVRDGRAYRRSAPIMVPWSNKELDVSFETFRNRLSPGDKEAWRVKITGKNKEKAACEMAATLYDASLDALTGHCWNMEVWPSFALRALWNISNVAHTAGTRECGDEAISDQKFPFRTSPALNWFGFDGGVSEPGVGRKGVAGIGFGAGYGSGFGGGACDAAAAFAASAGMPGFIDILLAGIGGRKEERDAGTAGMDEANPSNDFSAIAGRRNLNETAFFLPALETDDSGRVTLAFQMPEALTKWKLLGLAHTKDLRIGLVQKELVTQKPLMVTPNAPRFFREGDSIVFTAKVTNLSDKVLSGSALLTLFDASTMKPADDRFGNTGGPVDFSLPKGGSAPVAWKLWVPGGIGAVVFKVAAKAENFSDAEEQAVPVLSGRELVTESVPLAVSGKQTKKFVFRKLIDQNKRSATLGSHRLTLEFVSNPVWYAIQALPYLMEAPDECAEQVFGRFYANTLASHIACSRPEIKAVFDRWRSAAPEALLSNLEKNRELKAVALEETPWLLDGKDESDRKRRVAALFDRAATAAERDAALARLEKLQSESGAWPWFAGMPDDRSMTQYIVTGIGRLSRMGILDLNHDARLAGMVRRAVSWCDAAVLKDYEALPRGPKAEADNCHLQDIHLQYLYMRSFLTAAVDGRFRKAFDYYVGQTEKFWSGMRRSAQGMAALALLRLGKKTIPPLIIASLRENALIGEETGMYWKESSEHPSAPWRLSEAPVETQALMIEAFGEVGADGAATERLTTWLLKSKQTQRWPTTRATADAIYALLLGDNSGLSREPGVEITCGDVTIDPGRLHGIMPEAGTGYTEVSWTGSDIKPERGNISVTKREPGAAWGALYWQYFERLEKIGTHETPLRISKKLYRSEKSEAGPKLTPVGGQTAVSVGDKIIVRIELRVDRDMDYVHLKDLRAAGFEPRNVLSAYRSRDGLGCYESTRDAAAHFFFSRLKKGDYVFEYPLVATHAGDFSCGIATVQCMYAPEFTGHSEGMRVKVGK